MKIVKSHQNGSGESEKNPYSSELSLPSVQYGGSFFLVPTNLMYFVVVGPVLVHFSLAHQLHHGLQSARTAQRRRGVPRRSSHDQLLRPVHVRGREPVTPVGQLRRHIWNLTHTTCHHQQSRRRCPKGYVSIPTITPGQCATRNLRLRGTLRLYEYY